MFVESECKCIHPVIGMDQQDPLHILLLVTLWHVAATRCEGSDGRVNLTFLVSLASSM